MSNLSKPLDSWQWSKPYRNRYGLIGNSRRAFRRYWSISQALKSNAAVTERRPALCIRIKSRSSWNLDQHNIKLTTGYGSSTTECPRDAQGIAGRDVIYLVWR